MVLAGARRRRAATRCTRPPRWSAACAPGRRLRGRRRRPQRGVHRRRAWPTVEAKLGGIDLYDDEHVEQLSAVNVALHAHALLHRDVDYIVRDGTVELIDEMRGRVAQRRRWPDGLQAAVEAKEGLDATAEGEVLGTITVQAYIALYPTVCGMTATAVLRRRPAARVLQARGRGDPAEHARASARTSPTGSTRPAPRRTRRWSTEITRAPREGPAGADRHARREGVGERSPRRWPRPACRAWCSTRRTTTRRRRSSPRPARYGAVTVSTQMAGRGVDIRLGGSDQADRDRVAELGGLYVIGSGRHDSRRVDDQLRGRAGRQGDPGGSVFFVSLEDDLIVRHAPRRAAGRRRGWTPTAWSPTSRSTTRSSTPSGSPRACNHEIHRNTWRYSVVIEQQRRPGRAPEPATTEVAAICSPGAGEVAEVDALDVPATRRLRRRTREIATEKAEDWPTARRGRCCRPRRPRRDRRRRTRRGRPVAHARVDRPSTSTGCGPSTWPSCPRCARACTCGRWAGSTRWTSSTAPRCRRSTSWSRRSRRARSRRSRRPSSTATGSRTTPELVRPSATWTYLVHDNPFGSELDRLIAAVGRRLSGR